MNKTELENLLTYNEIEHFKRFIASWPSQQFRCSSITILIPLISLLLLLLFLWLLFGFCRSVFFIFYSLHVEMNIPARSFLCQIKEYLWKTNDIQQTHPFRGIGIKKNFTTYWTDYKTVTTVCTNTIQFQWQTGN